jgi:tRNA(adenine34) deaminase
MSPAAGVGGEEGRSSTLSRVPGGLRLIPPDPVPRAGRYRAGVDDVAIMKLALAEARAAGARGEIPVGAVVVVDGEAVAAAGNEREATGDPTAHAEILALRRAAQALGGWRLGGATVYATLEPCPMCAGALLAARVARLVFGAADPKAGACGSLYNLCVDPRLNHELSVVPGVRAVEASALLRDWFAARRPSPQRRAGEV